MRGQGPKTTTSAAKVLAPAAAAEAPPAGEREAPCVQIRKHFRFEAAHVLPHHPGKCAQVHGHSYRLEVAVRGPLQANGPARGMIEDFDAVRAAVHREILDAVDHASLNDMIENPTCERIVLWIWERLLPVLPGLDELVLWETATSCAVLRKSDFH